MKSFITDTEFNQASFDNVARLLTDYASAEVFSGGNPADLTQEFLEHLEYLSQYFNLSPLSISVYLDIVKENNQDFEEFESVRKDLTNVPPLGFNRGNVTPRFVTRG